MSFLLPRRFAIYLLREAIPYILLVFVVLTVLIFAQQISRQTELLFQSNASLVLTLKAIAFLLPGVVVITLPFSLLLGCLLALNRLSSDSEIIAARASGTSLLKISQPLIACGLCGLIACGYLTLYVTPRILTETKSLKNQLMLLALTAPLRPQTFDNHFPNHVIFLKDIDKITGDWIGVFIVRKNPNGENNVLTAGRGKLRLTQTSPLSLEVDLQDGLLLNYNDASPEKQSAIRFSEQAIKLSNNTPAIANYLDKDKNAQELSITQLLEKEKIGESLQERRQARVEKHKRFAIPMACIILVLFSIPLGISTSRQGGKAVAFSIGFALAVTYYLISVAGQNLALSGTLPAWLGVWLANIIGGLGTIALSITKDTPLRLRPNSTTARAEDDSLKQTPYRPKQDISSRLSFFTKPSFLNLINFLLLSEYVKFFGIAVIILVSTSIVFTLFDLVPSITKSGLGWQYALGYLLYLAPQITYYIVPFAVLIGLLSVFAILMKSNQITALLASGQSKLRIAMPLFTFSLLIIASLFWLSEKILPFANLEQDFRFNRIKGRKIEQTISALDRLWVENLDGTIYGYQLNPQNKHLLNSGIYHLSKDGLLQTLSFIKEGTYVEPDQWTNLQGWEAKIQAKPNTQVTVEYTPLNDVSRGVTLTIPESTRLFTRVINEATKMDFATLRKYIHYLSDLGAPTTALRVELEKKIAFPFSCLPLLAIGFPLAMKNSRRGTMSGIGLSIMIGFTFWITSSVFESLGKQSFLPPGLSVWGAQALFLAIGTVLMFRLKK